jgi:hypothetical protein
MKAARVLQPDLFAPEVPKAQPVATSKPQAVPQPRKATVPQPRKAKSHRTEAGDCCEGSIQIPGLSHSLCDRCGEWIATSKF